MAAHLSTNGRSFGRLNNEKAAFAGDKVWGPRRAPPGKSRRRPFSAICPPGVVWAAGTLLIEAPVLAGCHLPEVKRISCVPLGCARYAPFFLDAGRGGLLTAGPDLIDSLTGSGPPFDPWRLHAVHAVDATAEATAPGKSRTYRAVWSGLPRCGHAEAPYRHPAAPASLPPHANGMAATADIQTKAL